MEDSFKDSNEIGLKKIFTLIRNYFLSAIGITAIISIIIILCEDTTNYVYKDDLVKIKEVSRFKSGKDTVIVYDIEYEGKNYINFKNK